MNTPTLSGLTLQDHWSRMLTRLNCDKTHIGAFNRLKGIYSEPHRDYHGLGHLADVLEASELLCDELLIDTPSRGAVALAAFYHDSILDPARSDNEARSVEYMIDQFAGIRLHPLALSAATLGILGTIAGHEPQGRMAKIVSDADVLILGTSWSAYLRYATAVKREYCRVFPEDVYNAGRIEVLGSLMDSKLLYYAAGEDTAKSNMAREIELLKEKLHADRDQGDGHEGDHGSDGDEGGRFEPRRRFPFQGRR